MCESEILVISVAESGFVLEGEIDATTAYPLAAALAGISLRSLNIDMGGVTFIDSSGLRVLAEASDLATANGFELRLSQVPVRVQRIFELTGLHGMFVVVD